MTGGRGDQVIINGEARHVTSYMKDFLFTPEQTRSPLKVLSGGERARLMLARALAKPSNVLVLDEPTNDLDLETLDLLQELLGAYKGTVLLVSHDRDFLDRIVTSVIAAEGDGRWIEYPGGYSDMLTQRGEDLRRTDKDKLGSNGAGPSAGIKLNAAPSAPAAGGKKKLSFKDKHALETLPKQMEAYQADIAKMEATLAAPDLFAKDPAKYRANMKMLAEVQAKLAAAEERWLELELAASEAG
jgi:ABC transport system ATP-binding/permease protein